MEKKLDANSYLGFSFSTLDGDIRYDGTGLVFTPRSIPIPDGSYTLVNIDSGKVLSFGQAPVAGYTPADCASPAGNSSSGSSTDIPVSPAAENLIKLRSDGLYSTVAINGSEKVAIQGNGTSTDPFKITVHDVTFDGIFIHGDDNITVRGNGTSSDQIYISLNKTGIQPGVYSGFRVNSTGQIVDYSKPSDVDISITGINPITVTKLSAETFQVGFIRPTSPTTDIQILRYTVQLGPWGTIESVITGKGIEAGFFIVPALKTKSGDTQEATKFTYNEDGIIIKTEPVVIDDTNNSNSSNNKDDTAQKT